MNNINKALISGVVFFLITIILEIKNINWFDISIATFVFIVLDLIFFILIDKRPKKKK